MRERPHRPLLLLAGTLAALIAGVTAAVAILAPPRAAGEPPRAAGEPPRATGAANATGGQEATPAPPKRASPSGAPTPPFAAGLRVLRLVDSSRTIRVPGVGRRARTLITYVRYPALGAPGATDLRDAPAATAAGPFPLVVFGHGFAVSPQLYAGLMRSWTRAGYVVAAPAFPLAGPGAPGGPTESDLPNQPSDMSFVISRLVAESRAGAGPLAGLLDQARIAVAGQSDGGVTALAAAYSRRFRDRRIGAAVILSGAETAGVGGFGFAPGTPPLLAAQGTADTTNEPRFSYAFFRDARRPKYLLRLLGAGHLPPYTRQQPQLGIVERVTIAFLDAYLRRTPGALGRLRSAGNVPRTAALLAQP
jgi:dienelactone hydrolase